jgi:hypothetical protein
MIELLAQYDPGMLPTGHKVSHERLEEFRRIYKEAYGGELTKAEASEMAHRLLLIYSLLMRPLPGETSTHVLSQQPPAQTAPEAS